MQKRPRGQRVKATQREDDHHEPRARERTLARTAARRDADDEHDAEGATIGYERARLRSLLARAEAEVRELQEAVGRLAHGDYGRCTACGGEIPGERLAALPATPVCLPCAAAGDRR